MAGYMDEDTAYLMVEGPRGKYLQKACWMSMKNAKEYCKKMGKRLPTVWDMIKFAIASGAQGGYQLEKGSKASWGPSSSFPNAIPIFIGDGRMLEQPHPDYIYKSTGYKAPAQLWKNWFWTSDKEEGIKILRILVIMLFLPMVIFTLSVSLKNL